MLKIPNMGIHIVWTCKNTAHSDTLTKMGSVALGVADLLRKGDPNLPQGTNEILKIKNTLFPWHYEEQGFQ